MPANTLSTERYVVYSVDNTDDKSISSERSETLTFHDPDYVDLHKASNGNGYITPSSPVLSSIATDRWGSYWSRRERCCCFWNFLMTVTIIVLATIVVLVTKGIVDLRQPEISDDISTEKFSSADTAETNIPCTTPLPQPKVCTDETCARIAVDVLSKMNLSEDPCDDFYNYACGGYVQTTPVSWSSPRQRVNPDLIVQKHFETVLDAVAEEVQNGDTKEVTFLKNMFRSCIQHTNTPLVQVKNVIDSLGGFEWGSSPKTKEFRLTQLLAEAKLQFGVSPLFEINVQTDGHLAFYNRFSDDTVLAMHKSGKSVNRYRFLKPSDYIYRNENTDEILQAYKTYIGDFLAYVTEINSTIRNDQRFVSMVDDIYHLDVFINRVLYSEDMTNLSDGIGKCDNKIVIDELQYNYSYNISWRQFLTTILKDSPVLHNYSICYLSLSNALTDVLSGFSFTDLKRYIIFYTLTQSDIFNILPYETPVFSKVQWSPSALYNDRKTTPSDIQCVKDISRYLPVNYLMRNRIPNKLNASLRRLYRDLITGLEQIISDMYWVPIKQKRHLLSEISDLNMQLEWKKGTKLVIEDMRNVTDSYFYNLLTMVQYRSKLYLRGTQQFVFTDADTSILKLDNKFVDIPFAAAHTLLVSNPSLTEVWYGTMGTFIAQAISALFDIDALLRYLTEEKIDHRVALTIAFRIQCLVDEYNKYIVYTDDENVYKVRGDLTKSANFKDSLALRVAYTTYMKNKQQASISVPGLDISQNQMFFLTYAQTMCEKASARGIFRYYVRSEVTHHAPGRFRVIGTLSNFKKFSDAFYCPTGSTMNPKQKCSLF